MSEALEKALKRQAKKKAARRKSIADRKEQQSTKTEQDKNTPGKYQNE